MKFHQKKKLEIILESPILGPVLETIDRLGATGYTVLPSLRGRGTGGEWEEMAFTEAFQRMMIIVIADPMLAERIIEEVFRMIKPYRGIVTMSDVQVVRSEHF